jgi:hypothetical protein
VAIYLGFQTVGSLGLLASTIQISVVNKALIFHTFEAESNILRGTTMAASAVFVEDNHAEKCSGYIKPRLKTSIVIPVYNEEAGLPLVLTALSKILTPAYEVIVVDDGSQDQSAAVAQKHGFLVYRHLCNRGKGAAMRTGVQHARGENIIFLDADNTYPVDCIPTIVELLDQFDFVRGIRLLGRDHIPVMNRLGNSFFDTAFRILHSVDSGDVLSGMYGMHRSDLLELNLEAEGFDIETEIVTKAKARGLSSTTIPITYSERTGKKKLNAFRDGSKILYRVLQLAGAYNPVLTLILPGCILLGLGLLGIGLMLIGLPKVLDLRLAANTTFLLGTIALLGIQIIVFGLAVYEAASAYRLHGHANRLLEKMRRHLPTYVFILVGTTLSSIGLMTIIGLVARWWYGVHGPFLDTPAIVLGALSLLSGFQIVSSALFLSALKRLHHICLTRCPALYTDGN